MAYKVFTNGSVLQASEVNDNLMKQAVATFSNAAARTAAITSPVEGQLTYLEDTNLYGYWTGTEWRSPFGATLLNKTSYTSQTSVIVDNVFSSQYDTYKILLSLLGTANGDIAIRLRAAGSDLATANYNTQIQYVRGTAFTGVRASSADVVYTGVTRSGRSFAEITVNDPFKTSPTHFTANGTEPLDGISSFSSWGTFTLSTSATGFKIITPTSTGEIQVFGFRNA